MITCNVENCKRPSQTVEYVMLSVPGLPGIGHSMAVALCPLHLAVAQEVGACVRDAHPELETLTWSENGMACPSPLNAHHTLVIKGPEAE